MLRFVMYSNSDTKKPGTKLEKSKTTSDTKSFKTTFIYIDWTPTANHKRYQNLQKLQMQLP